MSFTKEEKLSLLKDFYKNMSDDEFKERMKKAGFEVVENRPGEIIFIDDGGNEESHA